jgi:hypothetical protein
MTSVKLAWLNQLFYSLEGGDQRDGILSTSTSTSTLRPGTILPIQEEEIRRITV